MPQSGDNIIWGVGVSELLREMTKGTMKTSWFFCAGLGQSHKNIGFLKFYFGSERSGSFFIPQNVLFFTPKWVYGVYGLGLGVM